MRGIVGLHYRPPAVERLRVDPEPVDVGPDIRHLGDGSGLTGRPRSSALPRGEDASASCPRLERGSSTACGYSDPPASHRKRIRMPDRAALVTGASRGIGLALAD